MLRAGLFLPSLPLDVFWRASDASDAVRPFIVTSGGHYPRVVAANAAARAAGIRRDQLVSAALALAPDVAMRERDVAAEEAALADIATLVLAFTPDVALAPPCAIVAEIAGSARLFGGLSTLVDRIDQAVRSRGYDVQMAIAPTPAAALLLARAGHATPVLERDALPVALAPLPLVLLDLDADTLATLKAAGISTFGAAQSLPRAGVARRFAPNIVDLLDRALGLAADPRIPYRPPPHFERRLPLPAPADTVEALGFAVNRLVGDLAQWLLARGLGVVRMSLSLVHERYVRERGTPPTIASFALGAPARESAHLIGVLRERLARIALPAPVEAIVLASDETAPLPGRNLGLLPEDIADGVVVPLVDRLRSRLGDRAVAVLAMQGEHRPERAASEMQAVFANSQRHHRATPSRRPKKTAHAVSNASDAPRPIWLLDEARPLAALLETNPWTLRDGPERIESGWWDGRDCRRDYFVAEKPDGEIVWIYRDHRYATDDGEWFMHGLFA